MPKDEYEVKFCYTAIVSTIVKANSPEEAVEIAKEGERNEPKKWPNHINVIDYQCKLVGYDNMSQGWNKINN